MQASLPLKSSSKTQRSHGRGRNKGNKQPLAAEDGQEARPHRVSLTLGVSHETVSREKQFGSPCKFCGERFGKHSLYLHQRKCRDHESIPSSGSCPCTDGSTCTHNKANPNTSRSIAGEVSAVKPMLRQSLEAVPSSRGLHQILLDLPPRPQTRTLEHSVLAEKGYSLPSIEFTKNAIINGGASTPKPKVRCEICGELIVSERVDLHQRTCRPIPKTVAKGDITFPSVSPKEPSTRGTAKTTHDLPTTRVGTLQLKKGVSRKPPTVVCYICGREYGSKSISIHEPQCLKKFELENRKLPISERKPLPKKTINHVVVNLTAQEWMVPWSLTGGIYQNEILQDSTDRYFQSCYSEWEKDLITCKTCGRKFAPERHVKHAYRCKAKPLPHKQN